MEKDVKILDAMNSNYEGRKHGKPSSVALIQRDLIASHSWIVNDFDELIFSDERYYPHGQRLNEGSLDVLRDTLKDMKMSADYKLDTSLEGSKVL